MCLRQTIEGLKSCPSLLLLALPTVEPLKLGAAALAGRNHWITSMAMIIACYAFNLLIVERLFVIMKPRLSPIPWFATVWEAFERYLTPPTSWPKHADRPTQPILDPRSTCR
jgi:hypothetical protein